MSLNRPEASRGAPPRPAAWAGLAGWRAAVGTIRLWLWAALAGAAAAVTTLGFHWLIGQIEWLASGQAGSLIAAARAMGAWRRVAVGAVGGLLAGLVLDLGRRWANRGPAGGEHLDYIDAARQGQAKLNDRTTLARSASALLSVCTGASIGREGPMVQLAAWVASRLAGFSPLPPEERNAIMICGIAAGIGSAYHAPVAGVVFVLELALGFFARHTVAPVLIASATSSALIYWLVEPRPLYAVPAIPLIPASLPEAVAMGVLCGAAGWLLLHLLETSRRAFAPLAALPLRLGLGGLLVGGLSAAVPEVWGNGYGVVSEILHGDLPWTWVALILATKMLATVLSSGSGAIGGVFTPTLFVGAASGYVVAHAAGLWLPLIQTGDPRAMAVIGMAAMLAAVTHAPLMSIVMVLEMTNQFQLTVPLLLACGVAYAISTQFGVKPLYGNPIEGHR